MGKIKLVQPLRTRDGDLYRATEKQVALLATLGFDGDALRLTVNEASAKIDELIANKPATQKQIDFIVKLGGVAPADLSAQVASEMIEQLVDAIDIDRIKAEISVVDLIGESFTVVGDGNGRRFTTQEHDSLKIFDHNNSWTWYSQDGPNGNHLGGSNIDWVMLANQCGRGDAIVELWARLNGRGGYVAPAPRPQAPPEPEIGPYAWKSDHWQKSVSKRLVSVQNRLQHGDDGQAGRDYLAQRGITMETAVAFGLGYGGHWNIAAGAKMPALFIPWQVDDMVSYVALRFLDVAKGDKTKTRIASAGFKLTDDADGKYYGVRFLFGLQNLGAHGDTLIVVEGEINAMSIYQCITGRYACDVLSFGPQKNLQNEHVVGMAQEVASRYQRIIIWADRPQATIDALGTIPNAFPVRSPEIDGKEYDANDLLQIGLLGDVLDGLLTNAGTGQVIDATPLEAAPIVADDFTLTFDPDPAPADKAAAMAEQLSAIAALPSFDERLDALEPLHTAIGALSCTEVRDPSIAAELLKIFKKQSSVDAFLNKYGAKALPTAEPAPLPSMRNRTGKPALPADRWVDCATLAEALEAQRQLSAQHPTACGLDNQTGRYYVRGYGWQWVTSARFV